MTTKAEIKEQTVTVPIVDVPRPATTPGWGGLRDTVVAFSAVMATAVVTRQTGSPEIGDTAGQAAGQMADIMFSTAVAVTVGGFTLFRKYLMTRMDHVAKKLQAESAAKAEE